MKCNIKTCGRVDYSKSKFIQYDIELGRAFDVFSTSINHALSQFERINFDYNAVVGELTNTSTTNPTTTQYEAQAISALDNSIVKFDHELGSALAAYENMKHSLETLEAYVPYYKELCGVCYIPGTLSPIVQLAKSTHNALVTLNTSLRSTVNYNNSMQIDLNTFIYDISNTGTVITVTKTAPNNTYSNLTNKYSNLSTAASTVSIDLSNLNSEFKALRSALLKSGVLFDVCMKKCNDCC